MDNNSPLLALMRQRSEVPQTMAERFQANAPYLAPGDHTYNTPLSTMDELQFRKWLQQNNVPFNPQANVSDYDMRGFFKALQQGNPRAVSAIDPHDQRMHYPDYWKTPYHETFSQESQWAAPVGPQWGPGGDYLAAPSGRILYRSGQ